MDVLSIAAKIVPVEQDWLARARERHEHLTKPPGSLGVLEDIACRIAAIQRTLAPNVAHKRIVVFAADHGITEEGVSPYPSEVTAQMVANFLRGGAAINALAQSVRAELMVVDAGVKSPIPSVQKPAPVNFIQRPIRKGTRNFLHEEALTRDEVLQAIGLGVELAQEAARSGVKLIGLGEMGIGNSTAASAITAALTGLPAYIVTGRGTGADDALLRRKQAIVAQVLQLHSPDAADPIALLCKVGGLEIAALVGVSLGAAAESMTIVCDGFIATASAGVALRIAPAVKDYLFAAHLSAELGHRALLNVLGCEPLLDLKMRLGEGTGAALAMGLIDAAVRAFVDMATFESAGVSEQTARPAVEESSSGEGNAAKALGKVAG